VSDEDFSNILGGALYLKGSTIEITSEYSHQEDDSNRNKVNSKGEDKNKER